MLNIRGVPRIIPQSVVAEQICGRRKFHGESKGLNGGDLRAIQPWKSGNPIIPRKTGQKTSS
jgi:hypothetical protein